MILHNKTGILVLYEAEKEKGELLPNEEVALALPADGVLHLCLRLPYGSMQQGANTGKRWLDRIFHKLSISQWDFAVVSEYVLGGLSMHSVVEVTRLKEDFDTASLNTTVCLPLVLTGACCASIMRCRTEKRRSRVNGGCGEECSCSFF